MNQKVLTFCAEARQYKVWSMAEPSKMLYHITDSRIDEIKISPGIMLLVLAKTHNYVRTALGRCHRCILTGRRLRRGFGLAVNPRHVIAVTRALPGALLRT